ncbi:PhzF family phenazine biosynthesis isomerase [Niallia sp. 01092]|uniref:PhzF family phenazine biosynthesis isomerase n=1 Tax=unclassified Niallia TaxID=2837522 RepID=UPI003FD42EBD
MGNSVKVYHYDAFSQMPNKGNPAGVVLDADHLTDEEMQKIAHLIGFNETSFLVASEVADIRIRYFTPGHEMDLCGHGTMAAIGALVLQDKLRQKKVTIETKAGIFTVEINFLANGEYEITMKQAAPKFHEYKGSRQALALSISILEEEIDKNLPIVYGSTGIWTLLIPIKKLDTFQKMKPINQDFPTILTEKPHASLHPFCLETYHAEANMHGRHFSSPYSGTVEDPVTGTASGVMGAYYATYINKLLKQDEKMKLIVEQGQEMNKDGKVLVEVCNQDKGFEVQITGSAVYVKEWRLEY